MADDLSYLCSRAFFYFGLFLLVLFLLSAHLNFWPLIFAIRLPSLPSLISSISSTQKSRFFWSSNQRDQEKKNPQTRKYWLAFSPMVYKFISQREKPKFLYTWWQISLDHSFQKGLFRKVRLFGIRGCGRIWQPCKVSISPILQRSKLWQKK